METTINKNFKEAVDRKDVSLSQSALIRLISKDRRLSEFETPVFAEYASGKLSDFWMDDDGETDFPPADKWDNDSWRLMCIELESNFSKKKFDFIVELMKHLRRSGHSDFQATEQPKSKATASNTSAKTCKKTSVNSSDSKLPLPLAVMGAAAGFVVGGVVGSLIVGRIFVGGLIGAVVLGGLGLMGDKNKKNDNR